MPVDDEGHRSWYLLGKLKQGTSKGSLTLHHISSLKPKAGFIDPPYLRNPVSKLGPTKLLGAKSKQLSEAKKPQSAFAKQG